MVTHCPLTLSIVDITEDRWLTGVLVVTDIVFDESIIVQLRSKRLQLQDFQDIPLTGH